MRRHGAWLGWMTLSVIAGCGAELDEHGREHEHEHEAPPNELEIDTTARGLIDCSERQDTGYSSGNPFAITVVTVDGKPVERETANAYYVMQQAAAADGVNIQIVSGFRTMAQQEYLYGCYVNCNCNNCNLAARPGYSNHQSGHALDLNTSSGGVLTWLNNNGARFGFMRTVPSEPWHWEWWGGGPGGGPCGACTPHCEGSEIIGQDCGRGDCGAFGARCVDDAIGVRCASVFCPDRGAAEVCVNETTIGHCSDGAIETGDCGQFAAYCSTAIGPARCVSAFCVGSAAEVPVAHDACLPDGQRYRCDELGGLSPNPCGAGEGCVTEPVVACRKPAAPVVPGDSLPMPSEPLAEGPGPRSPESPESPPAPETRFTAPQGIEAVEGGCACTGAPHARGETWTATILVLLAWSRIRTSSKRKSARHPRVDAAPERHRRDELARSVEPGAANPRGAAHGSSGNGSAAR